MTSKAIRWAMHDVVLLTTSGLAAATGFYLGIEAAEERATVEFNALSKVEERLVVQTVPRAIPGEQLLHSGDSPAHRLGYGRFAVSYYSGVERTRAVTLHLRSDGNVLSTRR